MANRRMNTGRGTGVICPACGTPNRADAEVCIECLSLLGEAGSADAGLNDDWQPPTRSRRERGTASSRVSRNLNNAGSTQRPTPRHNRAATIRQQARQAQPVQPGQPKKKAWWNDWKLGALALGALSLMGLRRSNIGENLGDTLADLPGTVDQWIDDNII